MTTVDRRGFLPYLAVVPFLLWLRLHDPVPTKPKPSLRSKREARDSRTYFGNEFGIFAQNEDGTAQRIL